MYEIKQSTAITVPFFVHDASGDAVTGLTDVSFTKRISKNGAAFGAMTVTITEMENGWYSIPLSTAHSDTLGLLSIIFTNAGAKQVNLQFRVEANLVDDVNTGVVGVQSDTDDIQTRLPAALVGGRMDANVGAISGDAPAADNLELDYDGTGYAKANSTIGTCTANTDMRGTDSAALASVCTEARLAELDAANIPTDVDAILVDTADMQPKLGTPAGADMSADIAAVKVDTAATLADTGTDGVVVAAGSKTGYTLTGVQTGVTVPTVTDVTNRVTANTDQINGNANAAARLALTSAQMLPGTVDTGVFTPTTTQFEADDVTEATADHYNGRVVIWTSGALIAQATDITDYALSGSNGRFTVTAMTEAPANNDTFIIV